MELEGLKKGLGELMNWATIDCIVTDGHLGVKSWLKTKCQGVKHFLDVWHVAKGIFLFNFSSLSK